MNNISPSVITFSLSTKIQSMFPFCSLWISFLRLIWLCMLRLKPSTLERAYLRQHSLISLLICSPAPVASVWLTTLTAVPIGGFTSTVKTLYSVMNDVLGRVLLSCWQGRGQIPGWKCTKEKKRPPTPASYIGVFMRFSSFWMSM